jgi:ethanolamine permease
VTSTVAAAGCQYAQAKRIVGLQIAFNVGLFLVMTYTILEAGNAITIRSSLDKVANMLVHEGLDQRPFIILSIMFLAWLNCRGVLATLAFNFAITAIAFAANIVLFLAVQFGVSAVPLDFLAISNEPLPYGWLGIIAALHFGLWYFLGIEGTCQAAEEVRSPNRSLPYGTNAGTMTLLITASLTWYVCSGLIPVEYLSQSGTPLFDAARVMGVSLLMVLLLSGTIFSTLASANGCINDASRAWFSMGRDRYLPIRFGAVHLRYRTPNRSIDFLVLIALIFALGAPLDQVITPSILSGLLRYTFMTFNMIMFRRKWPLGTTKLGYVHPFHPLLVPLLLLLCAATYFAVFLGYGTQQIAMMCFYIVASLWFHCWRYPFMRRGNQFTMPLARLVGY